MLGRGPSRWRLRGRRSRARAHHAPAPAPSVHDRLRLHGEAQTPRSFCDLPSRWRRRPPLPPIASSDVVSGEGAHRRPPRPRPRSRSATVIVNAVCLSDQAAPYASPHHASGYHRTGWEARLPAVREAIPPSAAARSPGMRWNRLAESRHGDRAHDDRVPSPVVDAEPRRNAASSSGPRSRQSLPRAQRWRGRSRRKRPGQSTSVQPAAAMRCSNFGRPV